MTEVLLGDNIAALRREKGITQEQLAQQLGVTFQAVSKWETGNSCPDVTMLPALADIFGVTLDRLFGRAEAAPATGPDDVIFVDGLPWEDTRDFYAVLYQGHKLLEERQLSLHPLISSSVTFQYEGPAASITSHFGVVCNGDVAGSIAAGDSVTCQNVHGDVKAGDGVTCVNVEGNVQAGDSVQCQNVGGSVRAGDGVTCTDVGGSVQAGDSIRCGNVAGDVLRCDSLHCGQINGQCRKR